MRIASSLVCTAAAVAALAAPAHAKTYVGREAAAVKCAAYFSYVSYVGARRGLLDKRTAELGSMAGTYILDRYVSGTTDQKMKAYKAILDYLPSSDLALYADANKYLDWCRREFLTF